MGATKDVMMEQRDEELSAVACTQCGTPLTVEDVQLGNHVCGGCQHMLDKDD